MHASRCCKLLLVTRKSDQVVKKRCNAQLSLRVVKRGGCHFQRGIKRGSRNPGSFDFLTHPVSGDVVGRGFKKCAF